MKLSTASQVVSGSPKRFSVPAKFHWLMRSIHAMAPLFVKLGGLESTLLRTRLSAVPIDRPIYILGLPRAGTTVSTQMLSEHPDVTTHRYSDFALPYTPFWWNYLISRLPVKGLETPIERSHRDRIYVTRDSPEGVEEMIWERFFPSLDPTHSSVMDKNTAKNPKFECFLSDHIRKLLLVRGRSRYVAKNNPSVVRMEYLQRVFPDARFLLFIRNPIDHIASMIKQDRLWDAMESDNPRQAKIHTITGHHQFGHAHIPLHIGDDALFKEICRCRDNGQMIRARALQWASVYGFIMQQIRSDHDLAKAVCIVRYEDLCGKPEATISRILTHTGLSQESFAPVCSAYAVKLCLPDYYRPDFSIQEKQEIIEITKDVAEYFGYDSIEKLVTL